MSNEKPTSSKFNLTINPRFGFYIVRGVYPVSEALPSEAALCIKYNISCNATRKAVETTLKEALQLIESKLI